jgi:hypothetical protein
MTLSGERETLGKIAIRATESPHVTPARESCLSGCSGAGAAAPGEGRRLRIRQGRV